MIDCSRYSFLDARYSICNNTLPDNTNEKLYRLSSIQYPVSYLWVIRVHTTPTRVSRIKLVSCRLKRIDCIFFGGFDIKNTFKTHELEQVLDPILQTANLEFPSFTLDLLQA